MKIIIEDKAFNVLCQPIIVPDIFKDQNNKTFIEEPIKRTSVDLAGAPDLKCFKEDEEALLNEEFQEELTETSKEDEKPRKRSFWNVFRHKKRKAMEVVEEIDFKPMDFKTMILDDDIPYIMLKSRQSNVSDLVVLSDYFPIGRMITELQAYSYISKCHGLIYSTDREHSYFGDCSQNTNWLNGQPLNHMKYYELKEGDILRLGQLEFGIGREKYEF